MKILLVEDDELEAQTLAKALTDQNYAIDVITDGQAGWELMEAFTYDLILLDVMLPQLDGITICRRLRSHGNRTPVLLLTAQDNNSSKVIGLDAGADDYVAKPYNLAELSARIRALLRRGSFALPPVLEWGNLRLDPGICEVSYGDQQLHLTPKEYSLLELFLRNRHRVFSCSAILDHLWSFEEIPGEDTVRAHIKGLRMKLRAAGVPTDPIETVYGIGYRLKPLQQPEVQIKGIGKKAMRSAESEQQTAIGVNRVWQQVKAKFNQRVATIEQAINLLWQQTLDQELRQQAVQSAHALAGSLGMFGLAQGSHIARQIENLWQTTDLTPDQVLPLSQLVTALRRELEQATIESQPESLVDERPWLLIAEPEPALAASLVLEAANRGIRGEIVTEPVIIRELIASDRRPDAVLLDFSTNMTEASTALLAELNACTPAIPALILTEQDSLLDRVRVTRLGGRGFLQKPILAAQVLDAVTQVLQQCRTNTVRIMAVDDDPQVLQVLHNLLHPWGIKLSTTDNPWQFWDTLAAVAPDLLILDVEMPQLSGIELCQVVRNDPRWSSLPVLFLTAHTDAETMQRVFAAGADDYVSKPIVGPELVTRILNRLERSRLLQNLTQTDALTRVANRRKATQELTQLLRLAELHNQPLSLAVLELNNLKQINHHYGAAIGDQALFQLGELLQRTFHGEDVVGRLSGAAFVVGMYGITKTDGKQRLVELLNRWQQQDTTTAGKPLRLTFSAGVVQYPQDGTDLPGLERTANTMLQLAKTARSDRIVTTK